MAAQIENLSLFAGNEEFEEAQALVIQLNEHKRGPYNKPKFTPPPPVNPYTEMKNLYQQLANWLYAQPILTEDKQTTPEVFDIGPIRVWFSTYDDFEVLEAEIIGTENMDIDVRIARHKALLALLRNGVQLDKAVAEVMNG